MLEIVALWLLGCSMSLLGIGDGMLKVVARVLEFGPGMFKLGFNLGLLCGCLDVQAVCFRFTW